MKQSGSSSSERSQITPLQQWSRIHVGVAMLEVAGQGRGRGTLGRACLVALIVVVTLEAAGIAGRLGGWTAAPVASQSLTPSEIEIRARGASERDLDKRLPADIAVTVEKAAEGGSQLEQYVFVKLDDGTLLVGLDPVNATVRTPRAQFRPRFVAGRGLSDSDRGQAVAVVGKQYADTHKTAFGYKLSGMVYPGHVPNVFMGDALVKVVGIFEIGSSEGDKLVVTSLAFAQTLARAPREVNLIVLTVRSAAESKTVKKTLETLLEGKADIRISGK